MTASRLAITSAHSKLPLHLPDRIQTYIDAVAAMPLPVPLVSLVLFGSAVTGAFADNVSDVDLIVVLHDGASLADRRQVQEQLVALEVAHGLRAPVGRSRGRLQAFLERSVGYSLSGFVCTRSDLVLGEAARLFGVSQVEALFVDRIVVAGILASAVTVWGEDLLPEVPILPLRRVDVFKALFNFANALVLSAAVFPVLPNATKYAMGALKHSLHSCYFCYHRQTASLQEEVEFFAARTGRQKIFDRLMELRQNYASSFSFVLGCLPALFRMHFRTVQDNQFPKPISRMKF